MRWLILGVICSLPLAYAEPATPPSSASDVLAKARKLVTSDGIDESRFVSIGGMKQWISVRSRHRQNPLLLVVHGGPGFTLSPVSFFYMRDWEEYFTVVQWDQRGAGKTYAANDPKATELSLSLDRMVADLGELTTYLCATYHQPKLVLFCHSFGTVLGVQFSQQHPERLYAYVGTGQFVDFARSEALGYKTTLERAQQASNQQAIADLEKIAPFPDSVHPERNLTNLGPERRWLAEYSGYYWRGGFGHNSEIAALSPDYSAADLTARDQGQQLSDRVLWGEIGHIDFTRTTDFHCPVILLQGRHDLGTSAELVGEWFEKLRAPTKQIVWFEDSAHMAYEEEPGKMLISLVREVLPMTQLK